MEASGSGYHCQLNAGVAIKAFATALEEQAVDGRVAVPVIRRLSDVLSKVPGPLTQHYASVERICGNNFALQQLDRQRTNYVGRIAVKTFSHLMADPQSGIERKHLGSFFSALRMILGEEVYSDLQDKCATIVATLPNRNGTVPWSEFYAHPEAAVILEKILVSVARTLRRFEPRKDWFLIVMNTTPTSHSLGSKAFIAKSGPATIVAQEFGEIHLMRLLSAMFANTHPTVMSDEDKAGFLTRWNVSVEAMFGPLFVEIAKRMNR
ncbi:MAG: hypothetical protein EPN20_00295 [Magnetospirillum sp.]|nr:MAG: hypothetical protein EPN20_00295 [Magnetospirillum sp.]